MNNNATLEQIIVEYGKSIIEKDYKKTVLFVYPKLFNFIPKKTIEKSLKKAYSNKEIEVQISKYNLEKIDYKIILDDIEYLIIKTSFKQKIRYVNISKEGQEEAYFHYEILKENYGESNVVFENNINQITANSISAQLAINENNHWTFLDIKANILELYAKFLPQLIMNDLRNLFPIVYKDGLDEYN